MSTRQKRGGKKHSSTPDPKVARVELPIQGPEVNGAQVNSPSSLPDLDPASESESNSEDEEDEEELPGLSDDEPENDPLRHLTVLQRYNLAAGKQGRQSHVNPNDKRDDVIETSTENNVSLTNYVAHRLTREELQKVETSRVALKSQNIDHRYPSRNSWQGKSVAELCTYLYMLENPVWFLIGEEKRLLDVDLPEDERVFSLMLNEHEDMIMKILKKQFVTGGPKSDDPVQTLKKILAQLSVDPSKLDRSTKTVTEALVFSREHSLTYEQLQEVIAHSKGTFLDVIPCPKERQ